VATHGRSLGNGAREAATFKEAIEAAAASFGPTGGGIRGGRGKPYQPQCVHIPLYYLLFDIKM
jgi:hypothetical protein